MQNNPSEVARLIDAYSSGVNVLRDAVHASAGADADARPVDDKWSIREVVCHLADAEILYADRIKRVLAENRPTLFAAEPERFRRALFCLKRSLEDELKVVAAIRTHMLCILKSCNADDFERVGVHSVDGPLTLLNLLRRVTAHIPHHVAFIEEKLNVMKGRV